MSVVCLLLLGCYLFVVIGLLFVFFGVLCFWGLVIFFLNSLLIQVYIQAVIKYSIFNIFNTSIRIALG